MSCPLHWLSFISIHTTFLFCFFPSGIRRSSSTLFTCSIVCPDEGSFKYPVTFWMVLSKVRLEAFMWVSGHLCVCVLGLNQGPLESSSVYFACYVRQLEILLFDNLRNWIFCMFVLVFPLESLPCLNYYV